MYFDFSSTNGGATFDTALGGSDPSCTSCNGVALSLGNSNNHVLVQAISGTGTASAVTQYTGSFSAGDGNAYKLNQTTAGTTPAWTMTSGTAAVTGVAIYETSGGATVSPTDKQRKYEKLDETAAVTFQRGSGQ